MYLTKAKLLGFCRITIDTSGLKDTPAQQLKEQ